MKSELKIGNLIKIKNNTHEVHELYQYDIGITTDDFDIEFFDYEEVAGVEITNELLEELGFEKGKYGYVMLFESRCDGAKI